jgi:hypothetical protein
MSQDPWAAQQLRRERRHWRAWPWGWAALLLAIASWASAFVLTVLVLSAVGSPGDGSHAIQAVATPINLTLALGATCALGTVGASVLALRLRRQPAGGGAALGLLGLLLLVLLLPKLL